MDKTKYSYQLMKQALIKIKNDINTTFVPVKVFSDEDLNQISLSKPGTFDFFGSVYSDQFKSTMIDFLESIGNDFELSKSLSKILITKAVIPFLVANHADCLWMTIRVMFPTTEYEIPRWHFDGSFYDTDSYQLKLAGTLVGPGTLFKKTTEEDINNFVDEYKRREQTNRQLLDDNVKNIETVQLTNTDVGIFTVGKIPKVAIHSEPNINQKRLFFSVVAGSADNIKQLATKWNKNFVD